MKKNLTLLIFLLIIFYALMEVQRKKKLRDHRHVFTMHHKIKFQSFVSRQKQSLIYAIPKHALPKEMSSIKIRSGKMVWMPGEKTLTVFGILAYEKVIFIRGWHKYSPDKLKNIRLQQTPTGRRQ